MFIGNNWRQDEAFVIQPHSFLLLSWNTYLSFYSLLLNPTNQTKVCNVAPNPFQKHCLHYLKAINQYS